MSPVNNRASLTFQRKSFVTCHFAQGRRYDARLTSRHQVTLGHSFSTCHVLSQGENDGSKKEGQQQQRTKAAPLSLPNLEPTDRQTRRGILRIRLFEKLFDYLKNYEVILQKLLPSIAFKAYKTFSDGSKKLFTDMKEFSLVYNLLSRSEDWKSEAEYLSRRQLELYLKLPQDLRRVGPVLAVSALPLAQNVVFPLALLFPKTLLSTHFWSEEVKAESRQDHVRIRHSYYPLTFQKLVALNKKTNLAAKVANDSNTAAATDGLTTECLRKIANGRQPSAEEILRLVPEFSSKFKLAKLSVTHRRCLVKMHENVGFLPTLFPAFKLRLFSNLLLEIDKAILREGGPAALTEQQLVDSCHIRGLDTASVHHLNKPDRLRAYLDAWLAVSSRLTPAQATVLLHLPILLGYNLRTTQLQTKITKTK